MIQGFLFFQRVLSGLVLYWHFKVVLFVKVPQGLKGIYKTMGFQRVRVAKVL